MSDAVASAADLLATIVAATRRIVEVREQREPLADLRERAARTASATGGFEAALRRTDGVNIIAECKRRSPSKGVLRADYDPVAIAQAYVEHLEAVRAVAAVPLLRKDFVVTEYQLHEARAAGADAVLLIVAALRPVELKVLHDHASRIDLDVLVEVHDATELAVAIDVGARIIGVNNRNLRTLDVDVHASETLIAQIPRDVVAVSESGLKSADDIKRLRQLGYGAFLIGEQFMTADNPGAALRQFVRDFDTMDTKDTEATKAIKKTKLQIRRGNA